jgi:hypothetical protein
LILATLLSELGRLHLQAALFLSWNFVSTRIARPHTAMPRRVGGNGSLRQKLAAVGHLMANRSSVSPALEPQSLQVIDETETDLGQLIEGDLWPLAPSIDIWEAAVDWVHYKARQIPQRPRRVIESSECARYHSAYPAISKIANALRTGGDLKPWLSDRIQGGHRQQLGS